MAKVNASKNNQAATSDNLPDMSLASEVLPALPVETTSQTLSLEDAKALMDRALLAANEKMTTGPRMPIPLIEVTSYLQLPLILKKLEGNPDNVRVSFPPPSDTDPNAESIRAEQKAIHELLSSRHSTSCSDVREEAWTRLESSYIFNGATDELKEQALSYFKDQVGSSTSATDAPILQVNHIIDLSSPNNELTNKRLVDQMVKECADGSSVRAGYILQVPEYRKLQSKFVQEMVSHLPTGMDVPLKAWIGKKEDWSVSSLPASPKNYKEISFAEIQRRANGKSGGGNPPGGSGGGAAPGLIATGVDVDNPGGTGGSVDPDAAAAGGAGAAPEVSGDAGKDSKEVNATGSQTGGDVAEEVVGENADSGADVAATPEIYTDTENSLLLNVFQGADADSVEQNNLNPGSGSDDTGSDVQNPGGGVQANVEEENASSDESTENPTTPPTTRRRRLIKKAVDITNTIAGDVRAIVLGENVEE